MLVEDPVTLRWIREQLRVHKAIRWLCRKHGCDKDAWLYPNSRLTIG